MLTESRKMEIKSRAGDEKIKIFNSLLFLCLGEFKNLFLQINNVIIMINTKNELILYKLT